MAASVTRCFADVKSSFSPVASVSLKDIYRGKLDRNIPVRHGDLFYVPSETEAEVYGVLGYNPDPKKGRAHGVPQEQWIEGIFSGTHGSYWDADGNLYVQDWNVSGRIMKLVRVKQGS